MGDIGASLSLVSSLDGGEEKGVLEDLMRAENVGIETLPEKARDIIRNVLEAQEHIRHLHVRLEVTERRAQISKAALGSNRQLSREKTIRVKLAQTKATSKADRAKAARSKVFRGNVFVVAADLGSDQG